MFVSTPAGAVEGRGKRWRLPRGWIYLIAACISITGKLELNTRAKKLKGGRPRGARDDPLAVGKVLPQLGESVVNVCHRWCSTWFDWGGRLMNENG